MKGGAGCVIDQYIHQYGKRLYGLCLTLCANTIAAKYRKIKKAGASAYANAPVLHQKADELPVDPAAWVVHHLFNL